ncbi:MAG: AEC family transporter [Endomicrobium sp.]|jgi:predicted permease|nr:AEC family transporter [Endomicrobium sp.]
MIENLIAFFLIMGSGIFFQWKKPGNINPDLARHTINTIVIRFFLPTLCFRVIATADMDINTILLPVSAILTISLSLIFSFIVFGIIEKFISLNKKDKIVLILAATFGNVTFLGLPLLTGLYGSGVSQYVFLYDLMATMPLLWFVGASLACSYGKGQKLSIKDSVKILAQLPPIWALILGFVVNFCGITLPGFLLKTLELMSMPIVSLMIFSVGLALTIPKIKETVIVLPAVVIKLCISPLIAYSAAMILGMKNLAFKSTTMEAAMPTMVLTLVIASQYKLSHKLAALAIVLTTAAGFITMPIISLLLEK